MDDYTSMIFVVVGSLLAFIIGWYLARQGNDGTLNEDKLKLLLSETNTVTEKALRGELREMNTDARDNIIQAVKNLGSAQHEHLAKVNDGLKELQVSNNENLTKLQESNEKKLEEMRVTVDEKLQSTLEKRISESFKLVGDRLEAVTLGLGKMQTIADDVGGLKKVLSNVSTRGAIGELQAAQILENILTPSQYQKNVQTNPAYNGQVEFAVKLPGQGENDDTVWLPIDCKFPKEDHERWISALESGDKKIIDTATKSFISSAFKEAKTITSKYVAPPHTTEFAIMFLATEGLYADLVRQPGLLDRMQRECRIVLAGPSNLAAILNSLQMGFRTLALESQASEVWQVLGAVKSEFAKFGDQLAKLHKQLNTAANTIGGKDESIQRRLRAMERTLRKVESLPENEVTKLLEMDNDESLD